MVMSIAAAIKLVPWADVVKHTPKVVALARKLWGGQSSTAAPAVESSTPKARKLDAEAYQAIELRLAAVEHSNEKHEAQLAGLLELAKELADQSAQLVRRVEGNRVRTVWLSVFSVAALLASLAALATTWAR